MRFCCLCGEQILPGDYFVVVNQYRMILNPQDEEVPVQVPLEDGTFRKQAHSVCPAIYGAPLVLVGADGSRENV